MKSLLAALVALFAMQGLAFGGDAPAKAPQWYIDDIAMLTAEGGRWIADNSEYKSENEQFDAYGVEWKSGFDGDMMTGRLFGVKDGKDTPFDFWEFRQYWHPARGEAVVEQFGWNGVIGVGVLEQDGDGTKSDQGFFSPNGPATRTGHRSSFSGKDAYVTESFDIVGDEWRPRRKYVWKRQPKE